MNYPAVEQDALLQAILETSVAAICVLDTEGQIVFANDSAQEILGLEPNEVVKRAYNAPEWKPTDVNGEPWPDEKQPFVRVMTTGQPVSDIQHAIEWPDGRRKILSINGAPIRNEAGEIDHLVFSVTDITERVTYEREKRENIDWMKRAVGGAQMGAWNWEIATDQARWSPEVGQLFGLDPDSKPLGLQDYLDRLHPDDLENVQSAVQSAIAERTQSYGIEHRIVRPSGEIRWVEVRGRVFTDERDHPVRVSGSVMDITNRKSAELALRRSEEMLRSVIETMPGYILSVGRDRTIRFINRTLPHLDRASVLGKDVVTLMAEESRDSYRGALERAFETGEAQEFEGLALQPEGEPTPFLIRMGPVKSEGKVQSLTIVGTDVSMLKQTEQALQESQEQLRQAQRLESVGRLAGGVAHDFNNLLTAIIGFADLVHTRLHDRPHEQRLLQQVRDAAGRGSSLTRQLLTFAREQVVEPKIIDLNTAIKDIGKMLPRLIGEDITVVTSLDPGLWQVEIDPGQFEQVVVNLAVNARDAMPDGGILSITSRNRESDPPVAIKDPDAGREWVEVSVADTGTGIDADTLRLIFEPFFTTKEPGKGTGLGLATCFGVVTQAGGTIEAESTPGQGAVFRIVLPRTIGKLDEAEEPADGLVHAGTETILLVEDDLMVRNVTREMLASGGYELLEAAGGDEALEVFEERNGEVDLLITDVVMPNMSGTDLASQLLLKNPEMKVLFVSGYSPDAGPLQQLVENNNLLRKPFSGDGLTEKVREILD